MTPHSGSGVTTSRTYTAGGTYAIKLTVTDNAGATDVVDPFRHGRHAAEPEADRGVQFLGQQPGAVLRRLGNRLDTDGTIPGYAWTFGDGSTGTGADGISQLRG